MPIWEPQETVSSAFQATKDKATQDFCLNFITCRGPHHRDCGNWREGQVPAAAGHEELLRGDDQRHRQSPDHICHGEPTAGDACPPTLPCGDLATSISQIQFAVNAANMHIIPACSSRDQGSVVVMMKTGGMGSAVGNCVSFLNGF